LREQPVAGPSRIEPFRVQSESRRPGLLRLDKDEAWAHRREQIQNRCREFIPASNPVSRYRGRFRGDTALVLGNGPSLNEIDGELLDKFHTFGANGVIQKHVPDFYLLVAAAAPKVFANAPDTLGPELTLVSDTIIEQFPPSSRLVRLNSAPARYGLVDDKPLPVPARFSRRPDRIVYLGGSVLFVALQLALFMGFSRVVLIGVDHDYGVENHEQIYGGTTLVTPEDDKHHFTQYWPANTKLHSDLNAATRGFWLADKAFRKAGATLLNGTPGSKLQLLPTINPQDLNSWPFRAPRSK